MNIETKLTAVGILAVIFIVSKLVFKFNITNWGSEMVKGLDQWYKDKYK